jgi:simple sugar transport system ATP-binding protein
VTALALELIGLTKRFGDVVACDGVSLSVAPGEVVAVVGENGAGKSTLMNMACGLYRPSAGEVRAAGEAIAPGSPRAAIAAGIGMVHQHFMLVGPLSVAENVALGAEKRHNGLFDRRGAQAEVKALSDRLGFGLDPARLILGASVATQQRVEILKVLYRGARVLILDEPTAVLAPAEADALLETVRALAREGKSVVLVSHKLREVLAVASRVAVMRRGKLVGEVRAAETSADALAALMVGEGVSAVPREGPPGRRGERVVALRGAHARGDRGAAADAVAGMDLELFAGEIAVVAGVDGNGQAELAEVLTGLRPLSAGTLEGLPTREALGHIPEDRQSRGLCLKLSVEENLVLGRHRGSALARHGLVDLPARRALAERLIGDLDIRPTDPTLSAASLSGGNQQKAIVARELLASKAPPRLVIAVQPTRGLDLAALANVHARLRAARDAGAAVLVVSLDLDEVRALGDRILVMARGRIVRELPRGADEGEIGRAMLAGGSA